MTEPAQEDDAGLHTGVVVLKGELRKADDG